MKSLVALVYIMVLLAGFAREASAAVSSSFSFRLAKAEKPPALDASLNDPAWQAGKVPGRQLWEDETTRAPATEATDVYALYDDTNLYIAFVAHQSSEPIVATQVTNDVGFGTDDFVAVGIDSSGAGSQAHFFEVTPRGVHYQQASENVRYRPTWRSNAAVNGTSWTAVMVIPLNSMRLHGGSSQTWRVGFFRNIAARGEHLTWAWDPTMQDYSAGSWPSFGDLRYWPSATGIALSSAAIRPKPRLEVFALSSSGADRNIYAQANGTFAPQTTRPFGADLSVPITPTINFVGTLAPDFSNVEVDQQTIAPQEFPRQLTEYRPFFAQGAQFINSDPNGSINFNTPGNEVFYSPSVGPFDRGAKIEGTYGLQSIGALSFRGFNEQTGDTFDDQAFGYSHALQDRSFQYWADGVLAHHSIAGTDNTYEFGARGMNPHSELMFTFNSGVERGSWVPEGIAHSTRGSIYEGRPNYQAVLQYVDISPSYNPIDGFTTISDIRGFAGYVNFNGSTPAIKNWALFLQGDRFFDRSSAVHEADSNVFLNVVFKNRFSINGLGPSTSELREYNGNSFTGYPAYFEGVTVPFNLMNVPVGYDDGTPTPIDVSAAWGSFGGNWTHFYTSQTSRPLGSRYTLGLEYDASYERSLATGVLESQFLRRISIGFNINRSTNMTVGLRGINGIGGFAQPGVNLAAGLHMRTESGDLYVNFGSPSAVATLDRLIVKYVLRIGADAGT